MLGIMSGTSLDGLDLCCCTFEHSQGIWTFRVEAAETVPYTDEWRGKLSDAYSYSGPELMRLHADYGKYIGTAARDFLSRHQLKPEAICSHGHTIFHNPAAGYTFQIGSGAVIAATSGTDTICDLRSTDVALGGQGAPLVPVGDRLLFGGHKFCLNLGGIANISFDSGPNRVAFDICPVNMALNFLASRKGLSYDDGGELASAGRLIPELYDKLAALPFYTQPAPKSLGREWFESAFLPLINTTLFSAEDLLHTVVKHIASCISRSVPVSPGTTMLVTGGGAHNTFLMECIADHLEPTGVHAVVPDEEIVSFKEAIIFAFLGALRLTGQPNSLSSVTGASRNAVSGALYSGK